MTWLHKGSRHDRGYGTAWTKLRAIVLRRDRWVCRACGVPGAAHCDHIVPKARGGTDELSNLQTLCEPCHRDKTTLETGGRPSLGCDADGRPVDPRHPWNRQAPAAESQGAGVPRTSGPGRR